MPQQQLIEAWEGVRIPPVGGLTGLFTTGRFAVYYVDFCIILPCYNLIDTNNSAHNCLKVRA